MRVFKLKIILVWLFTTSGVDGSSVRRVREGEPDRVLPAGEQVRRVRRGRAGGAVAGGQHRPAVPQPTATQQELRRLRLPGRGTYSF